MGDPAGMDLGVLFQLIYGNRLLLAIAVVVALVFILRARARRLRDRQANAPCDAASEAEWLLEEEAEDQYFIDDWPDQHHRDRYGDDSRH